MSTETENLSEDDRQRVELTDTTTRQIFALFEEGNIDADVAAAVGISVLANSIASGSDDHAHAKRNLIRVTGELSHQTAAAMNMKLTGQPDKEFPEVKAPTMLDADGRVTEEFKRSCVPMIEAVTVALAEATSEQSLHILGAMAAAHLFTQSSGPRDLAENVQAFGYHIMQEAFDCAEREHGPTVTVEAGGGSLAEALAKAAEIMMARASKPEDKSN